MTGSNVYKLARNPCIEQTRGTRYAQTVVRSVLLDCGSLGHTEQNTYRLRYSSLDAKFLLLDSFRGAKSFIAHGESKL